MPNSWKWNKPVHWADIRRSLLMFGDISDNEVRQWLNRQIASGRVRKVGYGLYQLAVQPTQASRLRPRVELHEGHVTFNLPG